MNEIEVKAILRDKEKVLEFIKNSGAVLLDNKYQKDLVFWPEGITNINDGIKLLGINYLRIRKQTSDKNGGKIIFTLKQPLSNQADCKEHEVDIQEDDIENLESIILALGYYEYCIIEKNRETYKFGDIEICLDDVTGLGSYIELEKFGTSEETERIQKELSTLLESMGVNKEDLTFDGYDILLRKAKDNL
jgi:adenylate cyclase class 2